MNRRQNNARKEEYTLDWSQSKIVLVSSKLEYSGCVDAGQTLYANHDQIT